MKFRQEAVNTAVEDSDQEEDIAMTNTHEAAEIEDLYATTYTAEEDHILHYGRIFLTELRTTPRVATSLSQPPQEYEKLLRFPIDRAVRLFDDTDGNARWISEEALYMHERVIQQDRVRLHPAADPIETILQRAESARGAGAESHLGGVSSYLRDAPAISRPTIADLLAEILEEPAGHDMFAGLEEDLSGHRAGYSPLAPQAQAAHANTTPSSDSYSIADAVPEGRRTNQRFDQRSVPSAAGLATPIVPRQTSAFHPSLPSQPVNATPLKQVSYASDVNLTTPDLSSTGGADHVSKWNPARQSSSGSSQMFGSSLPRAPLSVQARYVNTLCTPRHLLEAAQYSRPLKRK